MKANGQIQSVLVVDDEKVIADSLTAILCRQGYMARAVYSAEGAMNAASTLVPDTVISDVLMPEINGIELAAYFAEHHPECKVVLMSGDSAAPVMLDAALRQGQPHSTQNKPVAPMQVLELLAAFSAMA